MQFSACKSLFIIYATKGMERWQIHDNQSEKINEKSVVQLQSKQMWCSHVWSQYCAVFIASSSKFLPACSTTVFALPSFVLSFSRRKKQILRIHNCYTQNYVNFQQPVYSGSQNSLHSVAVLVALKVKKSVALKSRGFANNIIVSSCFACGNTQTEANL